MFAPDASSSLAVFAAPHATLSVGPYLSAAAFLVLMTWRWLWQPTRSIFGHWPTMLALSGISAASLALLLGLLRLYRAIPATARRRR